MGVTAGFAAAIVLAGYFRSRLGPEGSGVGVTTEVAAMVTFVLGTQTHERALLAAMLAVLMTVVLALKARIHQFAKAGVSEAEVSAVLILAVLALVVLPLLPENAIDPWGVIQPRSLWLVLVMLSLLALLALARARSRCRASPARPRASRRPPRPASSSPTPPRCWRRS